MCSMRLQILMVFHLYKRWLDISHTTPGTGTANHLSLAVLKSSIHIKKCRRSAPARNGSCTIQLLPSQNTSSTSELVVSVALVISVRVIFLDETASHLSYWCHLVLHYNGTHVCYWPVVYKKNNTLILQTVFMILQS